MPVAVRVVAIRAELEACTLAELVAEVTVAALRERHLVFLGAAGEE